MNTVVSIKCGTGVHVLIVVSIRHVEEYLAHFSKLGKTLKAIQCRKETAKQMQPRAREHAEGLPHMLSSEPRTTQAKTQSMLWQRHEPLEETS
jgi:hypothetical protein